MKQIIKNDIHLLNSKLKLNFPFHRVNVSTIKGVWEEGQCHSHGLGHTSHHKPAADDLGVAWPGLGRCPTAPNFPLGLEFNNFYTNVHRVLMTPYDSIYKEKSQLGVISE